jgi:hypothetical protein
MAQCTYHPKQEAMAYCSYCRALLCNQCALYLEGGKGGREGFVCSRCIAIQAAQEVGQETSWQELGNALSKKSQTAGQKPWVSAKLLIALAVVLIVSSANSLVYFESTLPEGEPLSDHPTATAILVDTAIRSYVDDHAGDVPTSLEALMGTYLDPEIITVRDLDYFTYTRLSRHTYELRPKSVDNQSFPEIIFTQQDTP